MSLRAPHRRQKASPPPDPKAANAELVERHRATVLELEARGYLPSQIATITKLPNQVVITILASKAPPKRGPK